MAKKIITVISEKRKDEYKATYDRLMSRALGREYEKGVHERHHIIPRSLGGSNEKSNIVCLTYREHFLAHWLLIKFTKDGDQRKMMHAFWRMSCIGERNSSRQFLGWRYELARVANSKSMIGNQHGKGYSHTLEARKKIGIAAKILMVGKQNSKGKKNAKGYKHTPEVISFCSAIMKGRINNPKGRPDLAISVRCIDDGRIFRSIKEASLFYDTSKIGDVCRGKRKTTRGFKFEYYRGI